MRRQPGYLRKTLEQKTKGSWFLLPLFFTSVVFCETAEELVFETRQRKADATCLSPEGVG
jgi:hypothetical protein